MRDTARAGTVQVLVWVVNSPEDALRCLAAAGDGHDDGADADSAAPALGLVSDRPAALLWELRALRAARCG